MSEDFVRDLINLGIGLIFFAVIASGASSKKEPKEEAKKPKVTLQEALGTDKDPYGYRKKDRDELIQVVWIIFFLCVIGGVIVAIFE